MTPENEINEVCQRLKRGVSAYVENPQERRAFYKHDSIKSLKMILAWS